MNAVDSERSEKKSSSTGGGVKSRYAGEKKKFRPTTRNGLNRGKVTWDRCGRSRPAGGGRFCLTVKLSAEGRGAS